MILFAVRTLSTFAKRKLEHYDVRMIFPLKSDYPNDFVILDHRNIVDERLYTSLIEASASAYFESDPISRYHLTRKFYLADELLGKRRFQKILDASTGIGYFVPHLSTVTKEVVGVERTEANLYAREMVKKRNIKNATIEQFDLLSLPYKDSTFDCVVSLSTLSHLGDHELKIVLNSFKRLLKNEGLLLIGCSVDNKIVRFAHNRLSFLFGKRLRTKQLLEASKATERIFYKPSTDISSIEKLTAENFGFTPLASKNLSLLGLKLYKVSLWRNNK